MRHHILAFLAVLTTVLGLSAPAWAESASFDTNTYLSGDRRTINVGSDLGITTTILGGMASTWSHHAGSYSLNNGTADNFYYINSADMVVTFSALNDKSFTELRMLIGWDGGALSCQAYNDNSTVGSPVSPSQTSFTETVITDSIGTFDEVRCSAPNNRIVIVDAVTFSTTAPADTTAPSTTSIVRSNPSTQTTDLDSVTWRVTFSEDVANVTSGDFEVSGTTAGLSVSTVSASVYDVTASGGDLAGLDGTVGLNIASGQDIQDLAGNALPTSEPATDETYTLSNSVPPSFSMAFSPSTIDENASSTLTFTIDNTANATAATSLDFTLNLPANVTVATTPNASTTCTGGTVTATAGSGTVSYTGGSVGAGASCTLAVDLTAGTDGSFVHTTGNLTSSLGNSGTASDTLVANDATAPTVSLSSTASDPVSGAFTVTATFSETVTGFILGDVSVGNGSASNFNTVSASIYTFTVTPSSDGTVTVDVGAGAAQDAAGNGNTAASQFTRTADATVPTVTLTTGASDPVSGAFTVTATFSEDVTGFVLADFTVGNGSVSTFSATSASVYTATVTPSSDGTVTVDVSAGAAQDAAGNTNTAATQLSRTADLTVPTVALTTGAGNPVSGAFTVTATFSEDVADFILADFTVGNGSASNFSATSASVYTATVTPSADGAVTVDVGAGAARDAAGNANTAATQLSRTADVSGPDVSLTTAAADPVSGAFTITATFSEDVTGFVLGDVSVGNGSASNFSATSASVYTATITPAGDGAVTVDVGAGVAQDAAGNDNTAATRLSRTADLTGPGLALSTSAGPMVSGAFTVTATFSEDVTGFALSDFTVGNGSASNFSATSASVYTATVTPSGDGAVTVDVAANAAQDAAGNNSGAAGQLVVTADSTSPDVTLSTSATGPVAGAFTVTATFSEDVTGFALSDVSVGNGSASNFSATSASVYTATITPSANGEVTVDIATNAAQDAAGNGNTAANRLALTADISGPGVTLTADAAGPVSGAFIVTATFSEDVSDFVLADFDVDNGSASDFTATSAAVFSATITPASDGEVTVGIAGGAAEDRAGNSNTAASPVTVVADLTGPAVTLSADTSAVTAGAFTVTVAFSEDVSGFTLEDLTVTGGEASDFQGAGASYTALITPGSDGAVSVDVAAGVARDAVGNDNQAAETFSIEVDATAPVVTIELPGETVQGPFTVGVSVSEPVSGFEIGDLELVNATASDFSMSSDTEYSVVLTPETLGDVSIAVAADAMTDAAGNGNAAISAGLEAISEPIEVEVVVSGDTQDVSDVGADVAITNPGTEDIQFHAEVDVPWIGVTPMEGLIPALGGIDLQISVEDEANELEPGVYTGTVTIVNDSTGQASLGGLSGPASAGGDSRARAVQQGPSTVVVIPLTITIERRTGTIELVATTPGGVHQDESFAFASSDPQFDGLVLETVNGEARSGPVETLFGLYDVTQAVPAGWRIDDISCSGDADGGSVIDLASGRVDIDLDPSESIVCTFANTRDEDAIRLATQRSIRNFMVRRGDRILSAAPDLSGRLQARSAGSPGGFSADMTAGSRTMQMNASLAGMRNHARSNAPQMPGEDEATGAQHRFDAWMSADASSLTDERAGSDVESTFGVFQVGADWRVGERMLVGVMAQRDWMDEVSDEIAVEAGALRGARVQGSGWMAGPYVVHEIADGLVVDALAMWGVSDNTVDPLGLYEDGFETERFLLRANVTGRWSHGPWQVQPSASLAHYEDAQAGYVDSLGIEIPDQRIVIGRLTAGPEIAYRWQTASAVWIPSVRLNGVWDYNPARLMDANGVLSGDSSLRLDAAFSLTGHLAGGASLSVEGGLAGLGDGAFSAQGVRVELAMPFN